ncbi:glucan 1,3-beta-glucosidase [Acrasis kona]|uniref:glucan 1,3-beta-glucosidase n=1 Tax=Acrasis kona TaxID=1008807 RepID=A0AAW2ZIQ3_9EUKA
MINSALILFISVLLFACAQNNVTSHVASKILQGTPIRGVNLGGWLLVEHSMTGSSSLWKGINDTIANSGEYIIMKELGHEEGDKRFDEHRATWITEKDIAEISSYGLNTVRVPVGFWITEFDKQGLEDYKTFAPGALKYLDLLIKEWGLKHNVAVFVDLHAAVGSQNGMDHSAPKKEGKATWTDYSRNIDSTLDVVEFLVSRYKDEPAFLGFGCLNEPWRETSENILKSYYLRVYDLIRRKLNSNHLIGTSPLLDDQDIGKSDWETFMVSSKYKNVIHEWHKYQIWGFETKSEDQVLEYIENHLTNSIKNWKGNPLIIGEWCFGTTGLAPFDKRDRWNLFSKSLLKAYSNIHWTFWSWRVSGDEQGKQTWSLRNMIRGGWFPDLNQS